MISRINAFSPTFGMVTKAAAKQAIKTIEGDLNKIKELEKTINAQNKNNPDVIITFVPEDNSEKNIPFPKDAHYKLEIAESKEQDKNYLLEI